jgi:ADP-heptose:LPS heptosyltransferase
MINIGRSISLLFRRIDTAKDRRAVLEQMSERRELQRSLPAPQHVSNTLLLIRLDDIGDYLLFRNQLGCYKRSPRWQNHRVVLLGNDTWRSLFELLDTGTVDDIIWVDKQRLLYSAAYRAQMWRLLRREGFETVIGASRTRPLLLDDLCMLAAAPRHSIGTSNTTVHESWNRLSDSLYTSLLKPSRPLVHESQFNAEFTAWACGLPPSPSHPRIDCPVSLPPIKGPYLMCFVGASTRSKRWPLNRWIEFIDIYRQRFHGRIVLAGNTHAELEMSRKIKKRRSVDSIAGAVSLPDLIPWLAGAVAIVTNDTMAAHMGVSLGRPTVIIANGVNYIRFSEYRGTGIAHVATVYPDVLTRHRQRRGDGFYAYHDAVSADIASISATAVIEELSSLLLKVGCTNERSDVTMSTSADRVESLRS